ncbi:MAG: tetratricopeptide repeat protein [Planctomycetes bacterium]|nr:tetratricopeptide repeat protein [Planctomycetota bacterium]
MQVREGASGLGRRDWLFLVTILLATLALYARSLAGELVYDDLLLIARNPRITDLANLPQVFGSGTWDSLGPQEAQYIGYWRPLPDVLHALTWPIAGSQPTLFHLLCLGCHLAATVAAFLLARRLSASTWIAAATAALFALHPAQVENVAWISALNGPLSGALVLFALERFVAWRERGSRGLPLLAVAFFCLALLAKELAAALLPLLIVVDLLRPRDEAQAAERPVVVPRWRAALGAFGTPSAPKRAYGPFLVAFALYLVARMLVFRSPWAGIERTTELTESGLRLALLRLELFGGALEILTVPIVLNLLRPFRPHIELLDPLLVRAAVFAAVYLALLVASLRGRRRLALTALLFIPLGFLPALIQVQSLGLFPLSERFLYLSVFGFALGLARLFAHAFTRRTATALVLALAALYALRSFARTGVWHDEEALFRTTAAHSPRSVSVLSTLGRVLLERAAGTRSPLYLAEAQAVFERAADLLEESKRGDTDLQVDSRDFLNVNLGLASCALQAGDYSAAILMLEDLAQRVEAIQEGARVARERGRRVRTQPLELERVYAVLGTAQYRSGEFERAERSFTRALELRPSSAEAHQKRGAMYAQQGRWQEAAAEFEATARLRPGLPEDRLLLAQALQTLGESARAETIARELLAELPRNPAPLIVLAVGAAAREDSLGALRWLERALELDPRHALAWSHKARLLLQRGDGRGALSAFRNALDLDPSNFEALYALAGALLAQGSLAEAQPFLVRAYALAPPAQREPLRRNLEKMELDPDALAELLQTDAARGELEPALAWSTRRLEHAPEDAAGALEHARLLRRLGRDEQALSTLRGCLERAPESYEICSELGLFLHALGQVEEARAVIEKALLLELPANFPAELREGSKQRLRALLDE